MIRILAIVIYLAIGMGVVSIEAGQSKRFENAELSTVGLSVMLWPMFPAGRIYKHWVGE